MEPLTAGAPVPPLAEQAPGSAFDLLETRSPEQREELLVRALAAQIEHAKSKSPRIANMLRDIEPADIRTREDLARLPILRRAELREYQRQDPPFGGLLATPLRNLARVYCSPGPVYVPEGRGANWWRAARALFAAGFKAGDIVANTFNHHMSPGAAFMESGARHLGCVMLPAGVGQPEVQASVFGATGVTGYVGTPSFLKQIVDHADAAGQPLSTLDKALVTGEHPQAGLRAWAARRGIRLLQCYAAAEIGLIAYEETLVDGTPGPGMVVDESVLLEILRPSTGESAAPGEVGEVVVTTLNPDYPLIRFATGDLSALAPPCPASHRTNMRISGWLGRVDQSCKVRGVFVHPWQVSAIAERHAEVQKVCLVVDSTIEGTDDVVLMCATAERGLSLQQAIEATARSVIGLRATARLLAVNEIDTHQPLIQDRRRRDIKE